MFSRKSRDKSRRRPRAFSGSPMLWYGDTLKTEMKVRRREENFYLTH